jgi:hypothetical protein
MVTILPSPGGFPRGRPATFPYLGSYTCPMTSATTSAICSAKGCRNAAAHELRWNNPKLHTPDRRKTWLACDDHRQSLSDFLSARDFLREVVPFERG